MLRPSRAFACGPLTVLVIVLLTPPTADLQAADTPWSYDLDLLEVRNIDGSGNSIGGATHTRLRRMAPPAYPGDGSGHDMLQSPVRENPRVISNRIASQGDRDLPNHLRRSDYIWAWGQFLDHDIDLTESHSDNGTAPIPILEPGDLLGPRPIPFSRSNYDKLTGTDGIPREQINEITAFIDASNVYGSDDLRAAALRTFVGGRLQTSTGNLLPFNFAGLPNAGGPGPNLFLAGDVRANENVMLTSLHTLFVREHNRLAALIQLLAPEAGDEEIYQLARKIVSWEMQLITYREFLPALLGPSAPSLESLAYDSGIDPSIANEFSTALYRFGHSLLSPQLMLSGAGIDQQPLPLRDAFFRPSFLIDDPLMVDRLLMGATFQLSQNVDNRIVDDVRNFLFGPPGAGGMDLASLNIQRGRDHGLPDYNTVREAYGLPRNHDFADISSDPDVQAALEQLYGDVANIDLWVGGLAEDHRPGSGVGELLEAAFVDQFTRLMAGDRMSMLNDPDLFSDIVHAAVHLDGLSLARIIRANTLADQLPDDVFTVSYAPRSDITATYDGQANRIHLTGNAAANSVTIFEVPFGFVLVGVGGSRVNGKRIELLVTDPRPHLTADLGEGADRLIAAFCRLGDCVIALGGGNDSVAAWVCRADRLAVDGGTGTDRYSGGLRAPRRQTRRHNLP